LPAINYPANFAVIIILHRKAADDEMLAMLLGSKTKIPVTEATEKQVICANNIYIAPPDYHLLIENSKTFSLDYSEKINYSRPSIDVTFQSAAEVYKNDLTAIILSGANADGSEGCEAVQRNGGYTIAQSPQSAGVSFMPQAAINAAAINSVFTLDEMALYINRL